MRAALAIALCAAGCFSDRGIAIEIDVGGTGAGSVELYLGKSMCDADNAARIACDGGIAFDGTTPLDGHVWFRDDPAVYTATVKGRTATFRLQVDTPTTLPIVVAVATASGAAGEPPLGVATLRDLAIPVHDARIVRAKLLETPNPVVATGAGEVEAPEERVHVWRQQQGGSTCVVVEHWRPDEAVSRDFVVPADDPDCDDFEIANECNPAAYHGTAGPGESAVPDCLAPSDGVCRLASHGCTDGGGASSGDCAALTRKVCVPDAFCGCPELDETCLRAKIDAAGPRITCTVPAQTVVLGVDLCQDRASTTVDLSPRYSAAGCDQEPLLGALRIEPFAKSHSFNGAEIEIAGQNDPCSIRIAWKGGTHTAGLDSEYGLIELETSAGVALLPIRFAFSALDCALPETEFKCSFEDVSDTLWSCAL